LLRLNEVLKLLVKLPFGFLLLICQVVLVLLPRFLWTELGSFGFHVVGPCIWRVRRLATFRLFCASIVWLLLRRLSRVNAMVSDEFFLSLKQRGSFHLNLKLLLI
jgi:hypothetical protein